MYVCCDGSEKTSALLLLVLGVLADDHDAALALDDLALLAHGLDVYKRQTGRSLNSAHPPTSSHHRF